jgi:hypothetical protein
MTNERVAKVYSPDGETVQVRFDLTDEQLHAVANATAAVRSDRYLGVEMTADDVLAMRELGAIADSAAERAGDGYHGGTLIMTVARLGLMVGALTERLDRMIEVGYLRLTDERDRPVIEGMLYDLTDMHLRALNETLGAQEGARVRALI